MVNNKIDILFVGGEGRSGSTILGNMLGQHPGFVHLGEVRYLWQKGVVQDRLCGCKEPFSRCTYWSEVASFMPSAGFEVCAEEMCRWDRVLSKYRRRWTVEALATAAELRDGGFEPYLRGLGRLYEAIARVSQGQVLIDSSKSPLYLYALLRVPNLRVHLVHLVRHPCAVAFSMAKRRQRPDAEEVVFMRRFRADRSARRWNRINRSVAALAPSCEGGSLVLRYEDFIENPAENVSRISDLVGLQQVDPSLFRERSIELGVNHGVWGNPSRFNRGSTRLRLDEQWRAQLSRPARWVVQSLTVAGRRDYGY